MGLEGMGLSGKLEHLALPDVFQILHLGKKSGRLLLTRREGSGLVLFRQGQVIYAASDSVQETLGSTLISQKALTEKQLMTALEEQQAGPAGKAVGEILLARGWVTRQVLERAARQHIERVIRDLLSWEAGFCRFDPRGHGEEGHLTVDIRDFLLPSGVNPERMLVGAMRLLAERRNAGTTPPAPEAPVPERNGSPGVILVPLKRLFVEMRSPNFGGDVTLLALRYAAQQVRRGVLLMVRGEVLAGLGHFGLSLPEGSPDERIRELRILLRAPSIFREVVEKAASFAGSVPPGTVNERFLKEIGGLTPVDAVIVPMLVNGRVITVFYGDNAPEARPVASPDSLEILLAHAGLFMEKSLLERKRRPLLIAS